MGSETAVKLRYRLEVLEHQAQATRQKDRRWEIVQFFCCLSEDELRWPLEPSKEASSRVPCVGHVNSWIALVLLTGAQRWDSRNSPSLQRGIGVGWTCC